MNFREVIKTLAKAEVEWDYPMEYDVAIDEAIKAVEKQMPKKPIGDLHSVSHYKCPICYSSVKTYEKECGDRFCRWCGQRLLWEAEE